MFHGLLVDFHFKNKWDPEIVEFYIYRFFRQIAFTLTSIFLPIYLYKDVEYSIFQIMIFFLILEIFFLSFIPLSGKIIEKIGLKHSILIHLPALIIFTFSLRFLSGNFLQDFWFLVLIIGIRTIPKAPMMTAQNAFITKHILKNKKKEGRSLSYLRICLIFSSLISPLVGGFISHKFGFETFFNFAIILMIISIIPLLLTKDEHFKIEEKPKEIINYTKSSFSKNFKLAEFGRWGSFTTVWILWPIFLFIILKSTSKMGLIISISGVIAMIISYLIGKKIDKKSSKKTLKKMTKISSFVFILRSLFPSQILLMATDVINKITDPILLLPYQKYYFDYIKSKKNLIETAISSNLLTKFPMFILILFLTIYFGILELLKIEVTHIYFIIVFLISGSLILFMNKISKTHRN